MTTIERTSSYSTAALQASASALARPAAASTNLLSSPEGGDAGGMALFNLYKLLLSQRDVATQERQAQIAISDQHREVEIQKEKQARIDQANAERKGSGFFGDLGMFVKHAASDVLTVHFDRLTRDLDNDILKDPQFWKDLEAGAQEIGKWAAVAGSIVLAGATCGAGSVVAGLVIAGAVLSTAGAALSDFHLLEKLGVDQNTAGWIALGLSVGGAACSGAGGALAAANAVSSGASAVTSGVRTAGTVVDIGGGASTAVGGGAHVMVATYEKRAQLAVADEQQAEFNIVHIETELKHVVDALKQSYESSAAQMSSVRDAQQSNGQALMGLNSVRA